MLHGFPFLCRSLVCLTSRLVPPSGHPAQVGSPVLLHGSVGWFRLCLCTFFVWHSRSLARSSSAVRQLCAFVVSSGLRSVPRVTLIYFVWGPPPAVFVPGVLPLHCCFLLRVLPCLCILRVTPRQVSVPALFVVPALLPWGPPPALSRCACTVRCAFLFCSGTPAPLACMSVCLFARTAMFGPLRDFQPEVPPVASVLSVRQTCSLLFIFACLLVCLFCFFAASKCTFRCLVYSSA